MAGCVFRQFRLHAGRVAKAHQRVRAALDSWRGIQSDRWLKALAKARSFEALFGVRALDTDSKGNVIGIECDADEWAGVVPILQVIAPLVDEGSYLLLFDDRSRYWRLRIADRALIIEVSEYEGLSEHYLLFLQSAFSP